MDKERAFFEAGIKLAAAFHQFIGIPISIKNAEIVEKAIQSSILLQPYTISAKVNIDRKVLLRKISSFGYTTLSEDMLEIEVVVKVGDTKVLANLKWDKNRKYPMMSAKLI